MDNKEKLRDLFLNPKFKVPNMDAKALRYNSVVCDEWIEPTVKIKDNKISTSYDMVGCSITASAAESIARTIEGMDVDKGLKLLYKFKKYLDNDKGSIPDNFAEFDIIKLQRSRTKCIQFPLDSYIEYIEKSKND